MFVNKTKQEEKNGENEILITETEIHLQIYY